MLSHGFSPKKCHDKKHNTREDDGSARRGVEIKRSYEADHGARGAEYDSIAKHLPKTPADVFGGSRGDYEECGHQDDADYFDADRRYQC